MIRIIRHISVRFWLTTLMVLPSGFILLPRFSGWLSADMAAWIFIPLMYVVFGLGLGIFMDIAGLWRIRGLVRNAQLWERSGIATRAEKKFIRAVRIYDSAWISPLTARRVGPMLVSSLARFYLASGSRRREIQGAASVWQEQNSKDKNLARFGFERIQDQDRMDFSARRLYRSFLDMAGGGKDLSQQDKARGETIRDGMSKRIDRPEPGLATLGDERVDLTTFMPGDQGDDGLLASLDGHAFEDGLAGWRPKDEIYARQKTSGRMSALISGLGRTAAGSGSFIAGRTGKAKHAVLNLIQAREKWWGRVRGIMIACLGIWLIFFVWGTLSHMFKTAEQPAQQIKVVIPKPFTIQVAAYHKKTHADKYMETLTQKGIESSVTVADGGGKTWYLVRVSAFTDQESAQVYGNRLKADHIIDDFFVTKK